MKRLFAALLLGTLLVVPASAKPISWVDFMVPAESMAWALEQDIASFEGEQHCSWIDILALAACRTGGACPMKAVRQAAKDLTGDCSPQEAAGELGKYFDYYRDAYQAALGGLVGSFAIQKDGEWRSSYGLKAFSPVAAGYGYSHCDDFGVGRSFGFKRKHLGNDLMGSLGRRWGTSLPRVTS